MTGPSPSPAMLAAAVTTPATIFVARHFLAPRFVETGALVRVPLTRWNQTAAAAAPGQNDTVTVATMVDAGQMWARRPKPNSAAACPAFVAAFHSGIGPAVSCAD